MKVARIWENRRWKQQRGQIYEENLNKILNTRISRSRGLRLKLRERALGMFCTENVEVDRVVNKGG